MKRALITSLTNVHQINGILSLVRIYSFIRKVDTDRISCENKLLFFSLDFETILALLDRLFTSGSQGLIFLGTIERRRYFRRILLLNHLYSMWCSRSTMLKLTYLVDLWQMKMEIIPLTSFNGETIAPHLVAGHDILLFSLTKNA